MGGIAMKRKTIGILLAAAALLVCLAVFAAVRVSSRLETESIVGTYMVGEELSSDALELSSDALYVCLYTDGRFDLYRQHESAITGTYTVDGYEYADAVQFTQDDGTAFTGFYDHKQTLFFDDGLGDEVTYPATLTRVSSNVIRIHVADN